MYECFLGALASSDEIFIKEAGEHCRRDIDPYRYSMQLNKTNACPQKEIKIVAPPSREYDEKDKTPTVVPSNGEMEYEYFENENGDGNVMSSSTDSKVQAYAKDGIGDNQSRNGETVNNELSHPVLPKLDLGTVTKTDNKIASHNRSYSKLSNHTLISILSLFLLLPNLFKY